MNGWLADGAIVAGAGLLVAAAWLLHPSAGLAVAGGFCLAIGLGIWRANR